MSKNTKPPEIANHPKLWHIILIAFIAIAFTAFWLGGYEIINNLIWGNTFVQANRWVFPVLAIFFSLIVGLAQKYLSAPNVINGGAMDAFKGNPGSDEEKKIPFVGTLITSFASLLSGASVGPEGSLGTLVGQISKFTRKKLKLSDSEALGFDSAAMASAYNGIIGSPLFTAVLATELRSGSSSPLSFLTWNLLAGAIGFIFFVTLGLPEFAKYIPFTPIESLEPTYIFWSVAMGLIGTLIAIFTMVLFKKAQEINTKIFGTKVVARALAVGVIVGIVGYFFPEVMFAGETQIFPMLQNPAAYGVALLIFFGLLKIVLLAISFKGGFLGGPTFPILFACTMIGLALSLIFPTIPISIFVLGIEAATITLVLNAPLTAILLVGIVGTADSNTVVLLVLSSVTAMFLGEALKKRSVLRLKK